MKPTLAEYLLFLLYRTLAVCIVKIDTHSFRTRHSLAPDTGFNLNEYDPPGVLQYEASAAKATKGLKNGQKHRLQSSDCDIYINIWRSIKAVGSWFF